MFYRKSQETQVKKLFTCLYGSKLYGTSTPTSDRDVKHVVLPSLDSLLLGKQPTTKVKKTNKATNVRNTMDDVDEEFIPLQVFARDFMMGQTYALELAFAIDGDHAEQTFYDDLGEPMNHAQARRASYFYALVQELRAQFLTSNVKAMMGYAVNQANLYSMKGERLNVVRAFEAYLTYLKTMTDPDAKLSEVVGLGDAPQFLAALALDFPKYFKAEDYDIGGGVMKPSFKLLEKTFPHTSTVKHSIGVVKALIERYGSRADAASVDNVDWKATMHALRIVDEGVQLLSTKMLSFPFDQKYVQQLLDIKSGVVELTEVTSLINTQLEVLKDLEKSCGLPSSSPEMNIEFERWLVRWLVKFYNL